MFNIVNQIKNLSINELFSLYDNGVFKKICFESSNYDIPSKIWLENFTSIFSSRDQQGDFSFFTSGKSFFILIRNINIYVDNLEQYLKHFSGVVETTNYRMSQIDTIELSESVQKDITYVFSKKIIMNYRFQFCNTDTPNYKDI
ncbi:hypothetical protein AB7360_04450 [Providencia alcalifaciens]|uniref:hypothetical protein n=1 Tax=Providencia alcalifaciens TaxID=126385 RepID=UPI00295DF106|nr:hypothetical protein [Providencia rettgeri]